MGDDSVEQCWYIFCLIKAVVSLCSVGAVILIGSSVFGLIRSKRRKRLVFKHPLVHPLGTLRPYRTFESNQDDLAIRGPTYARPLQNPQPGTGVKRKLR